MDLKISYFTQQHLLEVLFPDGSIVEARVEKMQPTVTIHPSSLLCVIANGFILTNILSIESISVYIRVLK